MPSPVLGTAPGNVRAMRRLGAVLAAAVLVVVGGCSGDDGPKAGSDPASSAPTSPAASASAATGALGTACSDLLDDGGLVQQTLDLADAEPQDGAGVQAKLFAIVSDGPKQLSDPVGQLVDFLDDQEAYIKDGHLDESITDAVTAIGKACA